MHPNDSNIIDPMNMLKLSNDLIKMEMVINRLEHDRIDILGNGDPIIDDGELTRLNMLGEKIWDIKMELAEKTQELNQLKALDRKRMPC